jgi:hypothetical protein
MMKNAFVALAFCVALVACDQNVERVNSDERLENAPPVQPSQPSAPGEAPALADAADRMSGNPQRMPLYKVFFMHQFVEALYSTPKNQQPNPKWASPLKDPANNRVWCTDCHSSEFDFAKMPKQRFPETAELEKNHEFMVELMTKWVGRLNSDEFRAKAKLKGEVTCTTCHATDPREK